jgi:small subunit ribosomal protein S17
MTDETTEPETPEEETPAEEVVAEAPVEEAPADDAPAEEAPAEEAAAEEPAAEEAPAEEAAAEEPAADAGGDDAPAEAPAAPVGPKAIRRAKRSAHTGEVKPSRSAEERQAERVETRRAKAVARSRRRGQEREKRAATPNGEGTPPAQREPASVQVRQGIVTSTKAAKTITVRVDIAKRHPKYQKIVRSTKSLHAHDETSEAREGDFVRVIASRPMSATKRWRLVEILERAK